MISLNTNTASMAAAYNLSNTNVNLQRSLNRLSSGSRINSSIDDAGGLAVSMKLSASIRRTEATQANVNNALSYLQTQDGVLKSADKVLSRMAELAQMATDVTKSSNDKALYQTEVDSLKKQLSSMITEEFNGISLFGGTATTNGSIATGTDAATLTVVTSHDGNQEIDIAKANLTFLSSTNGIGAISSPGTSGGIQVGTQADATAAIDLIDTAIQNLATLRASNGSEQVRLTFAADMLSVNKTNLEAANGRIMDVDIAAESANLARLNILQQAGTAMLAQANQSNQSLLRLLV
ncbi:MAG: flagellin [Verrucomicrobia bacterium]|nr:flagellin [Verrucomicrobiota bacterium]